MKHDERYQYSLLYDRSVHGFADTDLPTLISDLRKEEDNLCAHRGLVPGTTDQTFIVSLTQSFKSLYDQLMRQKDNVCSRSSRNRYGKKIKDTIFKSLCFFKTRMLCAFFCK